MSSSLLNYVCGLMALVHTTGVFHFCRSKEIHRTIPIQVSLSIIHSCVFAVLTYFFVVHHELLGCLATRCLAIKFRSASIHVGLFADSSRP